MGTFRNFRVKHLFIGVLAATELSIWEPMPPPFCGTLAWGLAAIRARP